jgi:hypothetical protein
MLILHAAKQAGQTSNVVRNKMLSRSAKTVSDLPGKNSSSFDYLEKLNASEKSV